MNYTTKYQDDPIINREYKSTLFCMAFKDKKDLLKLYNAVNDTNYENPEDLSVTTLENAIYLTMKNDKSVCCNKGFFICNQSGNRRMYF